MWLKIETGLPTKLEVYKIARELGINRAEVVGQLVNLWAWFDFNTLDGVINNIGSNGIIDAHTMQGFADAMFTVGWLEYNADWETVGIKKLILPNFERHNGQTAKKRANTQLRQLRFRNAKALASALPEKRREDKIKEITPRETTPFKKVVDSWNEYNLPKIQRLTQKRKQAIRLLCKEYKLEDITKVFSEIKKIPFLNGENQTGWRADFDYTVKPDKFLKIYEGGWDTRQKAQSADFDEWNK